MTLVRAQAVDEGVPDSYLLKQAILRLVPLRRKAYESGKEVLLIGLKPSAGGARVATRLFDFCGAHTWKTDQVFRLTDDIILLALPGANLQQSENIATRIANDFYLACPGEYHLDFSGAILSGASETEVSASLAGLLAIL